MEEQEKIKFVRLGKKSRDQELITLFENMRSADPTDTEYSLTNVLTIAEVIKVIKEASV